MTKNEARADSPTENQPLPQRKHPRLKHYDYSLNGYYYVTICTHNKQGILSNITNQTAAVELTRTGKTTEESLLALQERFPYVKVDKYVIMPTHIHIIFAFDYKEQENELRPALTDVVCAFKSLSAIQCNKNDNTPGRKIWQTSFYEEVVSGHKAYYKIWDYIENNPANWAMDEYYK